MAKLSDTVRKIVNEEKKTAGVVVETATENLPDELAEFAGEPIVEDTVSETVATEEVVAETTEEITEKQDVKAVASKFKKYRDKLAKKDKPLVDKWGSEVKVKKEEVEVGDEVVAEETVEEETVDEATAPTATPPVAGASRMAMIGDLTKAFGAMSKSDQVAHFEKMMAMMNSKDFETVVDNSGKNAASIKAKGDAKSARTAAMKEDVADLFAGEELTEEFKDKATTLFEAAVQARIAEEIVALEEAYEETLNEEIESFTLQMTEEVEKLLDHAVDVWMEENQVAIESQIRADIMEDFVSGLKDLFVEHYIEIPDDKVDVVENLSTKVEELEAKLNETINRNIELENILTEVEKDTLVDEVAEGLSLSQKEKFKTLVEGFEFDDADVDSFVKKLQLVKENQFNKSAGGKKSSSTQIITEDLDEAADHADEVAVDPRMKRYVEAASRTLAKK